MYKTPRVDILAFVALLLLATLMRLHGLADVPFKGDEWFTVFEAENRFATFINPIYYGLTLVSFELFGFGEWAARLPAAVLGILAPPLFYLLYSNVLGRMGAFVLAAITLLSAWHLDYSQFSRFYSGVFLFGGLAYYTFWRSFEKGSWIALLVAGLFTVIATGFHATSVFIGGSIVVFSVIVLSTARFSELWTPEIIKISRIVVILAAACALLLSPLLVRVATEWAAMGQQYGYGSIGVMFQLVKYIGPAVTVAAGLGLLAMYKKRPAQAVFFASAVGVPAIALVLGAAVTYVRPDYVFYSVPIWYALAAYLVAAVAQKTKAPGLASIAILALLIISMLPETLSYYTDRSSLDYRDVIPYLDEEYQQGDEIFAFVAGAGLRHYGSDQWSIKVALPYPYNENARWKKHLNDYYCPDHRVWAFVPIRRSSLAQPLRNWLFNAGSLKWRATSKRFDYSVFGYELFLIDKCSQTP